MFAKGNIILGVVLLILFLAAIPIVLYISNLEEIEEIDNENDKKEYISSLLVQIGESLPECPDPRFMEIWVDSKWFHEKIFLTLTILNLF